MGYRNWRQRWCKKEGNKVLGKENETKFLYFALLLVLLHLHVLNIGFLSHFSFPKTLFPSFLHHLCLQFLYPTNFLVRECFSLLVSSFLSKNNHFGQLCSAQIHCKHFFKMLSCCHVGLRRGPREQDHYFRTAVHVVFKKAVLLLK